MIRYNKEKNANEIQIIEIFNSLNGEGHAAGLPCVFIRTMGCNLRCKYGTVMVKDNPSSILNSFCFAKNQKGKYPFVIKRDGSLLRLDEVKIGDELLTKDPSTNETKICKVVNTTKREAEEGSIRNVKFGKIGNMLNVTGEHPFYTNKWTPIKDIKVGEKVKKTLNCDIYRYLVEKEFVNTLKEYSIKVLNNFIEKHDSYRFFGEKSPMYQKGCLNYKHLKDGILEMYEGDYPLKELWGDKKLVVHHLDENPSNDSIENMVILPKSIHDKLHGRGFNFSKNNERDFIEITQNNIRRKNRKYGNVVINIETSTHSYYVKAGEKQDAILVHNCDTPECYDLEHFTELYPERPEGPDWYTAKEIFDIVDSKEDNWKNKSICLTGGEPLLECNKEFMMNELIPLFMEAHYDVSVETNGSIDYKDYKAKFGKATVFGDGHREGFTIISDYKLPESKMTKLMVKNNLDLFDETDLVKMVVSDNPDDWEELDKVVNSGTKAAIYISPMYNRVDTEKMWYYAEEHADKNVRVQLQLHKYFFKNPNQKSI